VPFQESSSHAGLKPIYGTAEAVAFQDRVLTQRLKPG
jgi:hypothetical protein